MKQTDTQPTAVPAAKLYFVVGDFHVEITAASASSLLAALVDSRVFKEEYHPLTYDKLLVEFDRAPVSVMRCAFRAVTQAEYSDLNQQARAEKSAVSSIIKAT